MRPIIIHDVSEWCVYTHEDSACTISHFIGHACNQNKKVFKISEVNDLTKFNKQKCIHCNAEVPDLVRKCANLLKT